jgi:hypothetical protein
MVISGYHYHRLGGEVWSQKKNPETIDFAKVNGCVPAGLGTGLSLSKYLCRVDEEQGLIAEMDFRRNHFESMGAWNYENPDCLEIRYEEIIGNETEVFDRIFRHYELSERERSIGLDAVVHHSAKNQRGKNDHIRNPTSGQWRSHFTAKVEEAFHQRYPDLLKKLGYDD